MKTENKPLPFPLSPYLHLGIITDIHMAFEPGI